jgi:hypothetical protein
MRCQVELSLLFTCLAAVSSVTAGDLTSPKGFSLSFPDAWQAATKEQLDKVGELTKKSAGNVPTPVALITAPPSDGFAPNINVIVTPGPIVLNEKSEDEIAKGIAAQFTAIGVKPPEMKTGHITVDGKSTLTIAYERTEPASGKQLRQWTIFIPGKKQLYVVTCTSLKTQWSNVFPSLDETVKSMKVDLEQK